MKFLVTAGPTREAIDPVRYLTNRSSGRMGFNLAAAAAEAGHEVVLVSGPVHLETPAGVRRVDVVSAAEMYGAVEREISGVDVAVMAAAVADYRPARVAEQKIKKKEERLTLELEQTTDILGSMRGVMGFGGVLVGFAAETENLEANARLKLERKGCDLVLANNVGREDIGFDSRDNEFLVLFASGETDTETLAKAPKADLAKTLVNRIGRYSAARAGGDGENGTE